MNYVICAAGEGARFRSIFGEIQKPMIRIFGRTMLEWALESLPIHADDRLIIVCQANHRVEEKIGDVLSKKYPFTQIEWVNLGGITKGQLETALMAENRLDWDQPIVIYNCDNYFESKTLLTLMQDPSIEGIIPCFEADGTAWSFCDIDESDNVKEIREKERISCWATIGLYFFRDARKFVDRAKVALSQESTKEYYVAPLYTTYIDAGERVIIDRLSLAKPMGTPEQIEAFWNISIQDVISQNAQATLVVDIDDTITIEEPGTPYPQKRPHKNLINKLWEYKNRGYEIILLSSRRMATCQNDEAKVIKKTGMVTLKWLQDNNVPFDGIRFGKPYAQNGFYIDDKTIRPSEFLELSDQEIRDLIARERKLSRA